MKKIIMLTVLLFFSMCQATLIELEFDENTYFVDDTVTARLVVSDFNETLGAFYSQLNYEPSNISILGWSFGTGFDDGLGSLQFASNDVVNGALFFDEYSFSSSKDVLSLLQCDSFVLASFTLKASAIGQYAFNFDAFNTGLISFNNNDVNSDHFGASFNVVDRAAAVPEPATIVIFALALLLMSLLRKQSQFPV